MVPTNALLSTRLYPKTPEVPKKLRYVESLLTTVGIVLHGAAERLDIAGLQRRRQATPAATSTPDERTECGFPNLLEALQACVERDLFPVTGEVLSVQEGYLTLCQYVLYFMWFNFTKLTMFQNILSSINLNCW